MQNFMIALNAVLPMFLMIGVGGLAQKLKIIDKRSVRQATSLCFRAFMSVMMFYNVYTSDLSQAVNLPLIGYCVAGTLLLFFAGLLIVPRVEKRDPARGVMMITFFRSNVVLLGVPMTAAVFSGQGIGEVTILIAVVVPVTNTLSVVALELFRGGKPELKHTLISISKNPIVRGVAVGLVTVLLGIHLPTPIESAVASISDATTAMALVLLGAALDFDKFGKDKRSVWLCILVRLVVAPAIFITAAAALGFRGVALCGIMAVFSGPCAVSSYTMACEMDGDGDMAGELLLLTTGISCFTMFGWIFLLKTLALI